MTRLRVGMAEQYRLLHANLWPDMAILLFEARISDYRIWISPDETLLFAAYDYRGKDLAADLARIGAQPVAKSWAAKASACLEPIGIAGDSWAAMEQIFAFDPAEPAPL